MREDLVKIVESMKTLEPHVTKTRYPIRRGLELFPPSKYYTKEVAEEAIAHAQRVVKKVQQLILKMKDG